MITSTNSEKYATIRGDITEIIPILYAAKQYYNLISNSPNHSRETRNFAENRFMELGEIIRDLEGKEVIV